jgi:hypothetical protein
MGQVANNIRNLVLAVARYFVPVFPKYHLPAGYLAFNNAVTCICVSSGSLAKERVHSPYYMNSYVYKVLYPTSDFSDQDPS